MRADINLRSPNSAKVTFLMTGVAALLLAALAMSVVPVMGWGESRMASDRSLFEPGQSTASPHAAADPGEDRVLRKTRCEECGEIKSMRRVAQADNLPPIYEITVRMRDGSIRVNHDSTPANWRPGERITLIGGAGPAGK